MNLMEKVLGFVANGWRVMETTRLALVAALLCGALMPTTAQAAVPKMPKIFQGEWCGKSNKPDSMRLEKCPEDYDGRFVITPTGTEGWEHSCTLQSLTPTKKEFEYNATLRCGGEGETWTDYGLIGLHSAGHLYLKWGKRTDCKDDNGKKIKC